MKKLSKYLLWAFGVAWVFQIIAGIFYRKGNSMSYSVLLSVLCMKDSWRAGIPDKDKTELVTTGIYRFSRNPAFLGFDLMYVGVLLLYGNLLTLGFSVFAIVMLHLQILQEERYLVNTFGA